MKAAQITETGSPDVIKLVDLPTPNPAAGEIRVRVHASCVNPIDTYIRAGMIKMPVPMPYTPGCDFAGVVDAVGSDVSAFKPGDRVWGSNQGLLGRQGTSAEFICVDQHWAYASPDNVSDADLAAAALVGITAHLGLFRHAKLATAETLFVTGGSGGVGSMVLQMARIAGAKVITTAGDDAKANLCKRLGAEAVINYKTQDISTELSKLAPDGVDVWWETVREPDFERVVKHLRLGSRIVVMAGRDAKPVFPIGPFYTKDASLHGFAMFNAKPAVQALAAADIARWLDKGQLKANVAKTFPLADLAKAHELQEANTLQKAGTLHGKIVITM